MKTQIYEIDLKELTYSILKKWWLLALLSVIGFYIAYTYTAKKITPIYQTSTTLFIGREDREMDTLITLNDLMKDNQLFVDYKQIAGTRFVIEKVIKNLGIEMRPSSFKKKMHVYTIGKSRLFAVSFKHTDPQIATDAANELAKQLTIAVGEIVNVKNVKIIDQAQLPTAPIGPNKKKNGVVAAFLCIMVAVGGIFLTVFFDTRIKKEEDIEKILGLRVIGSIPRYRGRLGK